MWALNCNGAGDNTMLQIGVWFGTAGACKGGSNKV